MKNFRLPRPRFKLNLLARFCGIAIVVFALTPEVAAQTTPPTNLDQVTLTAIPPRLGDDGSLRIKPGESNQVQVRVKNASDQPLAVRTLVRDFVVGEDGETPVPVQETVSNRWSLASWVTVVPNYQVIPASGTAQVNLVITVPPDALPGGHYAMVTHNLDLAGGTEANDAGSASSVNQQVGTLLYVTVDGPINEEAFISNFNFPKFTEYGPVPFGFTVENRSDIHIKPRVSVEIYNMLGRKVDTLMQEEKNVFPLLSRDYRGQWHQVWGTGYYTAKVIVSYGTQGKVVMDSTTFWLLPIKLILTALTVLLVLIAAGISIRRHLIHRQDQSGKRVELLEQRLRQLEDEKLKKYED